jgi:16S rRNA (guanine527-N7)-methyltransferase
MEVSLNVSRETMEKLIAFSSLVEKWTVKINLISKASIPYIWERHIVDSVQIFDLAPQGGHWVDIGSGGGFPGIIVAILTQNVKSPHKVTLVESDQRKCAFLRTVIRELSLDAVVLSDRIEDIPNLNADVLSARALAELAQLLGFAEHHLAASGIALFPKGGTWTKEHEAAQDIWSYDCKAITSTTNPAAAVLKIKDITRV